MSPTHRPTARSGVNAIVAASLKLSVVRAFCSLSMAMSLISREVSHETTIPARIWPSSIRLATSTMPVSTPRQALLTS